MRFLRDILSPEQAEAKEHLAEYGQQPCGDLIPDES